MIEAHDGVSSDSLFERYERAEKIATLKRQVNDLKKQVAYYEKVADRTDTLEKQVIRHKAIAVAGKLLTESQKKKIESLERQLENARMNIQKEDNSLAVKTLQDLVKSKDETIEILKEQNKLLKGEMKSC